MRLNNVLKAKDRPDLGPFVAAVELRFAEFVGFAVKRTLGGAGDRYSSLPAERLRESITRGLRAVLDDLRDGTGARYGEFWRELAVVRARAGFAIDSLQEALDLNEALLASVARQTPDPDLRLAAIEALHAIHNVARRAQFESYAAVSRVLQAEQRSALERLGAPVIPLLRGVILVPLVGAAAATQVHNTLLTAVQQHRARFVVLDVTGLPTIDPTAAAALEQAGQGVRLLGAELVLVGVSAAAAARLVAQATALAHVVVHRDLQSAFEHALARMGLAITPRRPA